MLIQISREQVVRVELWFYRQTRISDTLARPELYTAKGIPHGERLEKLCILLSDNEEAILRMMNARLPSSSWSDRLLESEKPEFELNK